MNAELQNHLDSVFEKFSKDDYREWLLRAKEEYFAKTGTVNEEDDDYEAKMNCFNDWYVLDFIDKESEEPFIKKYIDDQEALSSDISDALLNVSYSLFEFVKVGFRKQIVLKDILHNKKIVLSKGHESIGLMEGDLFIGRIAHFDSNFYLLRGVCVLPVGVKSILKKQSRIVRKAGDIALERGFLMKVEALKTKWTRYGHLRVEDIFVF